VVALVLYGGAACHVRPAQLFHESRAVPRQGTISLQLPCWLGLAARLLGARRFRAPAGRAQRLGEQRQATHVVADRDVGHSKSGVLQVRGIRLSVRGIAMEGTGASGPHALSHVAPQCHIRLWESRTVATVVMGDLFLRYSEAIGARIGYRVLACTL